MYIWKSEYFCGNKVSAYGLEHGRVDYATLAKSFDAVLCNDIISRTDGVIGYWEQENGWIDNCDEIGEIREQIETLEEEREEIEDEQSCCCSECVECDCSKSCDYDKYQKQIDEIENEIASLESEIERLEEEQEYNPEIFQFYIISDNGAEILKSYTNEIVFYNQDLDLYVWGVTHWGTAWDYVLTDIKIELKGDE